jgi:hypothetical protein
MKLPRWLTPRFSLRTLFVLVTLAALLAWWVVSQLNWIRDRREFVANNPVVLVRFGDSTRAPGLLWPFGEKGNSEVLIQVVNDPMHEWTRRVWPAGFDDQDYLEKTGAEKLEFPGAPGESLIETAKRLYPEATRVRKVYVKAIRPKANLDPK